MFKPFVWDFKVADRRRHVAQNFGTLAVLALACPARHILPQGWPDKFFRHHLAPGWPNPCITLNTRFRHENGTNGRAGPLDMSTISLRVPKSTALN